MLRGEATAPKPTRSKVKVAGAAIGGALVLVLSVAAFSAISGSAIGKTFSPVTFAPYLPESLQTKFVSISGEVAMEISSLSSFADVVDAVEIALAGVGISKSNVAAWGRSLDQKCSVVVAEWTVMTTDEAVADSVTNIASKMSTYIQAVQADLAGDESKLSTYIEAALPSDATLCNSTILVTDAESTSSSSESVGPSEEARTFLYTHGWEPTWEEVEALEAKVEAKVIKRAIKQYGSWVAAQKLSPHVTIDLDSDSIYTFDKGWGTSLCWWAVGVGQWTDETKLGEMLDLIFSNFSGDDLITYLSDDTLPDTLGVTVARYNIGGSPYQSLDDTSSFYRAGGAVESFLDEDGTYNWSADAGQRKVLRMALDRNVTTVQAFSNSPPWFMTKSGSTTGNYGLIKDTMEPALSNLDSSNIPAYVEYLANVTYAFASDSSLLYGMTYEFDYLAPMNEPGALWWVYGNDQEGCRLNYSQQVSAASQLAAALSANSSSTLASGGEGNKPFQSARFIDAAGDVMDQLGLVTTHTYGFMTTPAMFSIDKQYTALQNRVDDAGTDFWVSEFGTGAGPLQGGLRLAKKIINDLLYLKPQAWNLWQVASLHQDLTSTGWAQIVATYPPDTPEYAIRYQYYSWKMFTAFIRPGSQILGGCQMCGLGRADLIAALLPDGEHMVVVAVHLGKADEGNHEFKVKMKGGDIDSVVATYITDATNNCTLTTDNPTVKSGDLKLDLLPQSITTVVVKLS